MPYPIKIMVPTPTHTPIPFFFLMSVVTSVWQEGQSILIGNVPYVDPPKYTDVGAPPTVTQHSKCVHDPVVMWCHPPGGVTPQGCHPPS